MHREHIAIHQTLYSMMELRIRVGEMLILQIGITRIQQIGKVTKFYDK